ncbi:hypothetical protein MAR_003786 [Mya arenaria]|uniref:Uncharacterized protein n=1 Tax=Mya arenaria TaxID=6604 RepID=A0ABY7EXY1_MYAAR|nr:hypothetical protein MAR_003786 [Mya arenaria]
MTTRQEQSFVTTNENGEKWRKMALQLKFCESTLFFHMKNPALIYCLRWAYPNNRAFVGKFGRRPTNWGMRSKSWANWLTAK